MSAGISLSELRYILFPSESPRSEYQDIYQEAFRCWKEVWSQTFQELDGDGRVFSDDFCRQSFVGSIFWRDRCVSLGFFHSLNFDIPTSPMDSYFKVWPKEALAKLVGQGKRVLIGSNITVDPQFRGDLGNGYRLKDLITGLMVKTFLASGEDVMTGTMRCNRGMNRAAHQFGASPLLSGVIHHGVEVELVAFYRRQLLEQEQVVANAWLEALWSRRIDYQAFRSEWKKEAV